MPLERIVYEFTVELPAPRPFAFAWATNFDSKDFERMHLRAGRAVERLADDLILLTDTFDADPFDPRPGGRTTKVKLVHLDRTSWSWTSTHVAGPAKYSQFLYDLTARGRARSRLRFRGAQVEASPRPLSAAEHRRRVRQLTAQDSRLWRHLAAQMGRDQRRSAV